MLRFALDESMIISEELRAKIAQVDLMLVNEEREPLSGLPAELVKKSSRTPESPEKSPSLSEGLLAIHAGLAALIAPATVQSLRATPPITGLKDILKLPGIVLFAIGATIVCLVGFILTTPAARPKPPVTPEQKAAVAKDRRGSGTQSETASPTGTPIPVITPSPATNSPASPFPVAPNSRNP